MAPALLGLTNTLARLVHKLDSYTERLDEAQQRSAAQHEQLLKMLPARSSHHARQRQVSAVKKSVPPIDPSYERLRTIAMFEDHTAPVWCLTTSGSNTLISGSEDATIRLWSLETMKAIGVLTGHESTVRLFVCLCVVCVMLRVSLVASSVSTRRFSSFGRYIACAFFRSVG